MRSEFYMNGYDDYIDRVSENPYAPGTAAWEDWEDGFEDAQADEEGGYDDYDEWPDTPFLLPDLY